MEGFGISPEELKRFEQQMKKFSDAKTKKLQNAVEYHTKMMASAARNKAPKAFGQLTASIRDRYSTDKLTGQAYTGIEYAQFIEFGTKRNFKPPTELLEYAAGFQQGKSVGNFKQFVESLKRWCKTKGIPEEAAFPIALKLINEGQKAQPFMYPALVEERTKFVNKFKKIMNENENT